MIVAPDFLDHWRTRMLVDALGGDEMAPMYVMRIWGHCQQRHGDRFAMPAAGGLKALCKASGDAQALEKALIDAEFVVREGVEICVLGIDRWLCRGRALDVKSTEWEELRAAVFQRDNYRCVYCLEQTAAPECDHIHPLSRGGRSHLANLATACIRCNRSKGSKTIEEWRSL